MRRVFFSLAVLGALAAAPCCEGCISLAVDGESKVVVDRYAQAVQASFPARQVCGSVFSRRGQCCAQSDVEKLVVERVRRMKKEYQAFKKELLLIKNYNVNYMKVAFEITRSFLQSKMSKNDPFAALGGVSNVQQLLALLERLPAYLDTLQTRLTGFLTFEEKCFSELLTYRANVVCAACTPEAGQYFDVVNKKLRIAPATCERLVGVCKDVFYVMAASKAIIYGFRGMATYKHVADVQTIELFAAPCTDSACSAQVCATLGSFELVKSYEQIEDTLLSDNRRLLAVAGDTEVGVGGLDDVEYQNGHQVSGNVQSESFSSSYWAGLVAGTSAVGALFIIAF